MLFTILAIFAVITAVLFIIERAIVLNLILYYLERRQRRLWILLGSPKASDTIIDVQKISEIDYEGSDETTSIKDPTLRKLFHLFHKLRNAQGPFVIVVVIATILSMIFPDLLLRWP